MEDWEELFAAAGSDKRPEGGWEGLRKSGRGEGRMRWAWLKKQEIVVLSTSTTMSWALGNVFHICCPVKSVYSHPHFIDR